MMLIFQNLAGPNGSAYLLSALIGVWAAGVAFYEVHVGNFTLPFPKRKKRPATGRGRDR
jgi:hypothetical protein